MYPKTIVVLGLFEPFGHDYSHKRIAQRVVKFEPRPLVKALELNLGNDIAVGWNFDLKPIFKLIMLHQPYINSSGSAHNVP